MSNSDQSQFTRKPTVSLRFSVLLRKPPLMMDSEYITTCATTLAEENQTKTDITIPSKLDFARHATLISTAFKQRHLQYSHLWNAATLDAYLSTFSAGLARWIDSSSRVPWSNRTLLTITRNFSVALAVPTNSISSYSYSSSHGTYDERVHSRGSPSRHVQGQYTIYCAY